MLIQCLSAICTLGVVIVGLLVMTRAINPEELGAGILRAIFGAALALLGLCLLKGLLLPILISWLVTLKQMTSLIGIVALAVIALVLSIRVRISKFAHFRTNRANRDKGEL